MRWFGGLGVIFHSIAKSTNINLLEFIALLFTFPCFKISNLFFEIAYALNQRRALLINRKNRALGIHDFRLQFEPLLLKGRSTAQSYHRLKNILASLERDKDS